MELFIRGELRTLVSIKSFREAYHLPDTFTVGMFQPKVWAGLGTIDRAGGALHTVRERMLAAIPDRIAAADWLALLPMLSAQFETELYAINEVVGLREEEIAFAVSGFGDVCSAMAMAIIRASLTQTDVPTFDEVYRTWLFDTVQVGGMVYEYPYENQIWMVQMLIHAYGRMGLVVSTPLEVFYVVDKALACPAEGYMVTLLTQFCGEMVRASTP